MHSVMAADAVDRGSGRPSKERERKSKKNRAGEVAEPLAVNHRRTPFFNSTPHGRTCCFDAHPYVNVPWITGTQ